jgi:hypothetical protein
MFGRTTKLLAATVSLAVIALVGGAGAQSASAATTSNEFGTLKAHKVVGEAKNGATFKGQYHVTKFVTKGDKVKAVGRLTGDLTKKSGKVLPVSQRVRFPVNMAASKTTALPSTSGARSTAAVGCQVLDLVLGPLDLDLLGLQVHLNQVHLNITAVPGAGNLLGNLLCAVAGLLDGTGIGGLSGILTNLLNAILGILQA